EASLREMVKGHGLTRDLLRPPARQGHDHRTEADARGGKRDCSQGDPGVGDGQRSRAAVVPEKEAVPALCFCLGSKAREQPWVGEGAEVGKIDRETHRAAQMLISWRRSIRWPSSS